MSAALVLDCSPSGERSVSRRATERLVGRLRLRQPELRVLRRDLAAEPPPLVDAGFAAAIRVPAAAQGAAEKAALAASERLIAELEATDLLVIGTPMHNFTVPAVLKAWIDQVLRIARTFRATPAGKIGLLADRPAYVVVASGGFIIGERARQPDFLTPYLAAVLATLGIRDLRFLHLDGTARGAEAQAEAEARLDAWLEAQLPLPPAAAAACR